VEPSELDILTAVKRTVIPKPHDLGFGRELSVRPSVRLSVRLTVRLSSRRSLTPKSHAEVSRGGSTGSPSARLSSPNVRSLTPRSERFLLLFRSAVRLSVRLSSRRSLTVEAWRSRWKPCGVPHLP